MHIFIVWLSLSLSLKSEGGFSCPWVLTAREIGPNEVVSLLVWRGISGFDDCVCLMLLPSCYWFSCTHLLCDSLSLSLFFFSLSLSLSLSLTLSFSLSLSLSLSFSLSLSLSLSLLCSISLEAPSLRSQSSDCYQLRVAVCMLNRRD